MRLLSLFSPLLATLAMAVPTPENDGGGEEGRCGYFLIGDYKVPVHGNNLCNPNYNFNWFYIEADCECKFYTSLNCLTPRLVRRTIVNGPFEGYVGISGPGEFPGHQCWVKN
ncbi:hypothetical protein K491DRAFT_369231 [Lophiostoma macrostomum CBS 122681]|uniref:Uncharacterized protein n=1 Tax=Lophiostoma macrostomum CBS 122681 TaxID=1314788 RepID=A0A6A6T9H1_9PLEO|nr:hypothetical protein K491DRAFT_369231 [Lophiostoma macrostomum CBS 122681]